MPPDTFKNQAKPVSTVGFPTVLITNKELPEPIAYTVTKTVVENKDALVRGHAGLAEFDPEHGVAARQGRHPSASGRRAGVPRKGVDEIAADLVLDNGRILTLDPRRPVAAALAVAGGRDRWRSGGRGDVRRWRDRRTRVIDLRGATVIPGPRRRARPPRSRGPEADLSVAGALPLHRRHPGRWSAAWPPRTPKGEWIVTMPVGAPPFYQDAPSGLAEKPLAHARRSRRRRARPSRVHPRHLGLLEPAAGLLGRQQPWRWRWPASRATRPPPRASRSSRTPPASRPASSSSTT